MTQYPSLPLPALAPGETCPCSCPCCGALRVEATEEAVSYACCAFYLRYVCPENPDGADWIAHRGCPRPSPAAVLRAVLASLTPEQRDKEAWREYDQYGSCGESSVFTVEDRMEEIIDALEKPNA